MFTSENAKVLRTHQTDAEKKFWFQVNDRKFEGLKFRRQVKLGNYILDFVCFEKKLIVEIDGGQHGDNEDDKKRDKYFKDRGYIINRYWNNEVLNNIEGVLMDLKMVIDN